MSTNSQVPELAAKDEVKNDGDGYQSESNSLTAPLQVHELSSVLNEVKKEPDRVAPLQSTANRWVPHSARRNISRNDYFVFVVDRKVRGLLNRLTVDRFASISVRIIAWANRSENENDGRTLIQVIRLVIEHAAYDPVRMDLYARLCRKMADQISPNVRDEGVRNNEGRLITGGQLFCIYLLNTCQDEFERGWAAKENTAAAAASKAESDAALMTDSEGKPEDDIELYSSEYYAAEKARHHILGLLKCIGELFKDQILPERIMHDCIKKLLTNVDNPGEEEIKILCQLLTTTGQILDTPRSKRYMDVYFARMKERMCKNRNLPSRMRYMLLDVIELRQRRWVPRNVVPPPPTLSQEQLVTALDELTIERFEFISDQIIEFVNGSDGRTLLQVIQLLFEKATDDPTRTEMYALLCRKMMDQISPYVQDEGIRSSEGIPIGGEQLFRTYLLNLCQGNLERGSAVKFVGEVFKLQMLTERIMHERIKKLLINLYNPKEEDLESLCDLLAVIGQSLDTPKARAYMDIYFMRVRELRKNTRVSSRIQSMLRDVIELRERKWIPRDAVASPSTVSQLYVPATKEKAASERDKYNRQMNMSRGGSRGGDRGDQPQHNADGLTAAGRPAKAGDLSNFGKISKPATMTFGPSAMFAPGKKVVKRESASIGRSTSANMLTMLQNQEAADAAATASKSSRASSRRPSADFTQSRVPVESMQRRKLQLIS